MTGHSMPPMRKQQAFGLLQANRLLEARAAYTDICNADPRDAEAWLLLGVVNESLGSVDEAVACCCKAVEIQRGYVDALITLGNLLKRQKKFEEAIRCYQEVPQWQPQHFGAFNNIGNSYLLMNKYAEAADNYTEAIAINPGFADAHNNLGMALRSMNRLEEAEASFRCALKVKPDFAVAHNNLGSLLRDQERIDEAELCYREAVRFNPAYAVAHYNLASVLMKLGRNEEARAGYEQAMRIKPDYIEARHDLGRTLEQMGRLHEAAACYREVLNLKPDYAPSRNNLGNVYQALGRMEEAIACYREALRLDAAYVEAYGNLGNVCIAQGRIEEAIVCYEDALRLRPDHAEIHSNLVLSLNYREVDPAEIFNAHLEWARRHAEPLFIEQAHSNLPDPHRRLRVGYVSPDLWTHSVAFFFEPLLAHHDRTQVETFCYSDVIRADATTERLRSLAGNWRSICGLSHERVANLIREDAIDILVDLTGHMANNRLLVFARKPAPVQVSYLGYPNTTGLTTVDYRFTDMFADPPRQTEHWYTEQLIRLPNGFLCYRPPEQATIPKPLPGLTASHLTFGSFNVLNKITPGVIACWAEILRAVPDSRLLLKNHSFADATTRERYVQLFAAHGIVTERLDLIGWVPDISDHLSLYHRLDLALDTFPYNGTTTTCEALWMGVPVITLAGRVHAGRVGVSLLSQVGLKDFIATDPDDYVNRAVRWANDLEGLARLRAELRDRMAKSPFCDAMSFAHSLEGAYRTVWQNWCAVHASKA